MIHRDYIMRMLELFAASIAKILGLKEQKQYIEAVAEIDRAGELFFGMDFKLIKLLSDTDLIRLLRSGGFLDIDKCGVLAELLRQEAEILGLQNKHDECLARQTTALSLFLEGFLQSEKMRGSEIILKIEGLIEKTRTIEFPIDVKRKLFSYYENSGKFHKAEDVLFELPVTGPKEMYDEGIAFFERLACKPDHELIAGQLPREEVQRGLEDFKKQYQSPGIYN